MSKQYETGHARNVASFQKLIEQVTIFPEYNPAIPALTLESLTALYPKALSSVNQAETQRIAYSNAVHARQQAYKPLKPTATRVVNYLELLNLPAGTEAQARSLNRAIQGSTTPKKQTTEKAEDDTPTVSTSRQSYTQLAENFSKLLQLLATIPTYTPNTEDLQLPTLTTYHTQLVSTTQTVDQAEAALNKALMARDEVLYADIIGLYAIAQNVKKYVKSLYGATSPEYEKVVSISFKDQ